MTEQLPNHLATFECTHAVGYPVHWNITSNANITPIYENGSDKSKITIPRVSKSMNLTSVQCWQSVSGIVVVSEVATLIVTGEDRHTEHTYVLMHVIAYMRLWFINNLC